MTLITWSAHGATLDACKSADLSDLCTFDAFFRVLLQSV
jgi:hypothetical protein